MKTLQAIADEAVESILAAREQGKRAASYGFSLLNRNPRVIQGIRTTFRKQATRLGLNEGQIQQAWTDVKELAILQHAAEK